MRLFMLVPVTPSAAASDPGGRRYSFLIVSTVLSPVSLTTAKNLSPVFPGVDDTGQK
jgi:hypothetical protein